MQWNQVSLSGPRSRGVYCTVQLQSKLRHWQSVRLPEPPQESSKRYSDSGDNIETPMDFNTESAPGDIRGRIQLREKYVSAEPSNITVTVIVTPVARACITSLRPHFKDIIRAINRHQLLVSTNP